MTKHYFQEFEAPKFIVPFGQVDQLSEGDSVHLEAQITPVDDPNIKIEWFRNGQPLSFASRFKPLHDFGFIILDILHVVPEDSGEYLCRASNQAGQATSTVQLQIAPGVGLITQSQVKAEKAKAIQDLEDSLHRVPEDMEQVSH